MASETPLAVRGRHLPALDGLRALAVLGVIAYHLGFSWASGGFLGVDLFFVLSGFLITGLLLEERLATGRIALGAFWARRARRLLPGLGLMLVTLGIFLAIAGPAPLEDLGQIRADAVATVLYVANWHQLAAHQSYFASYAAPSPLQHTWSLGIEEQFYLLWPLLLLGLLAVARRSWRLPGALLAGLGAAGSAGWMALLALGGASTDRLYYGTDTRAFDLLVGALLAFFVAGRPLRGRGDRALSLLGPAAAVALGLFWWRAGGGSGLAARSMFEWGFACCAGLALVVVADVRRPETSPLGRLLSLPPLGFVGRISYELYLWHWPVITELTSSRVGLRGLGLDGLQVVLTFLLAAGSYYLFDLPIRRRRLAGLPSPLRLASAPALMGLATLAVVVGTLPVAAEAPAAAALRSSAAAGGRPPGAGGVVGEPIRLSPAPSASHRLRVALVGDSVMRAQAPAVAAALQATGEVRVHDLGFDGWGLTTDTGWRTGVPASLRAVRAELVVCMWSFDDAFAQAHPTLYRRWLRSFVRTVLQVPGVEGVVFEQFPVLGPLLGLTPREERRAISVRGRDDREWNAMVEALPPLFPHKVMYFPLGRALTRKGRFSFFLPPGDRWSLPKDSWVRVRSRDGVHLCPAGAARYAGALLFDLRRLYHLRSASPRWAEGAWTRDPRYNEPAGNCPADHPS